MLAEICDITHQLPLIVFDIMIVAFQVIVIIAGVLVAVRFYCFMLSLIRKDIDKFMRKVHKDGY